MKVGFTLSELSLLEVVEDNYIVLVGGALGGGVSSDAELIHLKETRSSSTLKDRCQLPNYPLQLTRANGEVTQDGIGVVCGGLSGSEEIRKCYKFNAESWKWESMPNMIDQRRDAPLVRLKNDIFAIAGGNDYFNSVILDTVEVYRDGAWEYVSPFPYPVLFHCAVAINATTLMVISGAGGVSTY